MNFSGSMDIVIGVSDMFGVPLAENFQRPFSATSLSEVWRKWHMTLGFWLKDYVMYPTQKALTSHFGKTAKKIFGKKVGKDVILYTAMLVVWFCVGLWHGGSWKYIFGSGLFFFMMIVSGLMLEPLFKRLIKCFHINIDSVVWRLFQRTRTLLLFAFSVSFGRSDYFMGGLHMWRNAFQGFDFTIFTSEVWQNIVINDMGLTDIADFIPLAAITAISVLIVFAVSCFQERFGSFRVLMKKSLPLNIFIIIVLLVATFCIGGFDNSVDLIYGNF
jgi:D-alanyl-lipoteichoic acid acyltransferase DltB (MBOAT superfamily)